MNTNFLRAFESLLSDQPYAYHPILSRISDDAKCGIFLNYLCHWGFTPTARNRGGWFYQSVKDVWEATALTGREQSTARFKLAALGFIEIRRGNPSGVWNYRIKMDAIADAIDSLQNPTFSPLDDQATFDTPEIPDDYTPEPPENTPETIIPEMRNPQIGNAENANPNCGKRESLLTVKNPVINNIAPNNGASSISEKRPKHNAAERRKATLQALVTGERENRGPNCVNFPADTQPFAKLFIGLFGREPIKTELAYWIRGFRTWRNWGFTPEDIQIAYSTMQEQDLTIKSPESLNTIAWKIHSGNGKKSVDQGPVARETY